MVQAGVDVSKHGGHAYPGMEDLYNVELEHMNDDIMTDVPDPKFHGSSGIDYPGSHSSKLQAQVRRIPIKALSLYTNPIRHVGSHSSKFASAGEASSPQLACLSA